MTRRLARIGLTLVAMGGFGVLALLAILWIEHGQDIALPTPTGRFAVGRTTTTWTDAAHQDPFAPGSPRQLVVWIWYPATDDPAVQMADYLPADWRSALANHQGVLLSTFLTRDLARVHSNSRSDAPLSAERQAYPVVVLRAGLAALTTDYTTLAEDLASHGYVVVGFDAPHRTALVVLPGGRVVTRPPSDDPETLTGAAQDRLVARLLETWTSDIAFAVDRLEQLNASDVGLFSGRLDLAALGVVGHSLGGAAAAQFCHDDRRCRAGVDLDGALHGSVVREGLSQPFMFMLSDRGQASDPESLRIVADIQAVYDRLPPDRRLRLVIRGANHFSFSDQLLVRSQTVMRLLEMTGVLGLEPRRGLAIAAEFLHRFFDVHLTGAPAASLEGPSPEFPELQFDVGDRSR